MKLVLETRPICKVLWPRLLIWRCDLRSREASLYRLTSKRKRIAWNIPLIGRLLASTPDGSMAVNRQQRDYNTCVTMSTSNLPRLT